MTLAAPGPLAGLDPGRSKCGLVLTDPQRLEIRQALVLPPKRPGSSCRTGTATRPWRPW